MTTLIVLSLVAALLILFSKERKNVLPWIALAWGIAWGICATTNPALWPVAALGFAQNIAFTLVSRGRNSGSLFYHLIAAIGSNGLYILMLFYNVDAMSKAKDGHIPWAFIAVYTLTCMSGSIFAHWLAMKTEKGKQKSVQEDRVQRLERAFDEKLGELSEDIIGLTNDKTMLENRITELEAAAQAAVRG